MERRRNGLSPIQKAEKILTQPDHALYFKFLVMPSGRRYYVPAGKTNDFIPSAIRLLNTTYNTTIHL